MYLLGEIMITRTAFSAIFCYLAAAAPLSATANEKKVDRRYQTVWHIQSDSSQVGARPVATGQPILEQRLLPSGLAVANEDILSNSGKILVKTGEQLFQLQVNSGKTFCVVSVPRPSFYRSFMLGGGNLQLCLVDADENGIFDGQFNGGNPMKGVPFIEGRQPKEPQKASGRYSMIEPSQFSPKYTVRITLARAKASGSGNPAIAYSIDFGDDQTRQSLTGQIPGKMERTSILGAEWNITEVGNQNVTADVSRPMPSQPFQAVRTVTFR